MTTFVFFSGGLTNNKYLRARWVSRILTERMRRPRESRIQQRCYDVVRTSSPAPGVPRYIRENAQQILTTNSSGASFRTLVAKMFPLAITQFLKSRTSIFRNSRCVHKLYGPTSYIVSGLEQRVKISLGLTRIRQSVVSRYSVQRIYLQNYQQLKIKLIHSTTLKTHH